MRRLPPLPCLSGDDLHYMLQHVCEPCQELSHKSEANYREKKLEVVFKVYYVLSKEDKRKLMKTVASFSGVDSISMDRKRKKITVTGDMDPFEVLKKLRKHIDAEMFHMVPVQDEKKKKKDKN